MNIEFSKISQFERGTLLELLKDAYSFDRRYEQNCLEDWQEFDNFFFDNLQLADQYGFMTALDGKAIGFVSWDPRQMPRYAEIGHNCIATAHKGKGYSTMQLQEAVDRILRNKVGQIRVTTNDDLIPAQRMYERVGFVLQQKRHMGPDSVLKGEHWDYVYRP
ncbi:N-acetyltransferase GCN5 [Paenibacillus sp. FSL R7-277]|uniref:GNAT family N-acetyltransferase n=1 Tax=Paenibacillus sp. FSL R7-277 TaxID=1227352 RepID=UPI0003E23780|nr:GNAT family N-acetyltransferase [Paenibacillus sp. FSL R7-277]ETT63613.1 N-acetyltransferase GCN5 [Paenibacillus sp. FSL R7-277]